VKEKVRLGVLHQCGELRIAIGGPINST
jgi:hypothetical protein